MQVTTPTALGADASGPRKAPSEPAREAAANALHAFAADATGRAAIFAAGGVTGLVAGLHGSGGVEAPRAAAARAVGALAVDETVRGALCRDPSPRAAGAGDA